MSCHGLEYSLSDCDVEDMTLNCTHAQDVALVCNDDRFVYPVRLTNGTSFSNGRVEIYQPNGQWGTICDLGWTFSDVNVVCKQLGFSGILSTSDAIMEGGGGGVRW